MNLKNAMQPENERRAAVMLDMLAEYERAAQAEIAATKAQAAQAHLAPQPRRYTVNGVPVEDVQTVFASDLNLRPGKWPTALYVTADGVVEIWTAFEAVRENGELLGMKYTPDSGRRLLMVYND